MKILYPFPSLLLLLLTFCTPNTNQDQPDTAPVDEVEQVEPMRVYVFEVGNIQIEDISVFNPGVDEGKEANFTNSAYLIKHPEGTLIWDTGLPDALADTPEGNEVPGFLMTMPKRLSDQMDEIGVDPATIDYLAVSHEHGDHIGNMELFTNATLLLQEEEYQSLFENEEREPSALDSLKSNPYIKLSGDHDVFGDSTVVIKRTPGHTAGHQVLFIDLPETGPVVLSGDLYHFSKNRENRGVPVFNYDNELTLESMDQVEDFIEEKNATLWIQHEMEHEGMKWSPEFYE